MMGNNLYVIKVTGYVDICANSEEDAMLAYYDTNCGDLYDIEMCSIIDVLPIED